MSSWKIAVCDTGSVIQQFYDDKLARQNTTFHDDMRNYVDMLLRMTNIPVFQATHDIPMG